MASFISRIEHTVSSKYLTMAIASVVGISVSDISSVYDFEV